MLAIPTTKLVAQNDTIIVNNNYKFKIGIKGLFDGASIPSFTPIPDFSPNLKSFNFGFQGIYKIGNSKSSIESGIYYYTREINAIYKDSFNNFYVDIYLNNINIPLKYRLDTRIIYFTVGVYGEFFLNKEDDYNLITYSLRKFNVGYTASVGFEKNITPQLSLFFEGTFSSHLTSMDADDSFFYFNANKISYQLSTSRIAIGINYKILKNR